MVLHSSDLVAGQVQDPQVLQTPEHVGGDQVDEVAVEGQLQQLALAEEGAGFQRRDAVVLEVEVVQAGQPSQVLEADLHDGVVLEKDGLLEDEAERLKELLFTLKNTWDTFEAEDLSNERNHCLH